MMNMFKLTLAAALMVSLSACSSLSATLGITENDSLELPVVYGTLKVIERDNGVNQGDVMEVTEKLKNVINKSDVIQADVIASYVQSLEQWEDLTPADRYLLSTLLTSVEETIESRLEEQEILPEDVREEVLTIIGWIENAAVMY